MRRPVFCKTAFVLLPVLLCGAAVLGQERILTADGQSPTYTRIKSVLSASPETPDCSHLTFGPHITYGIDEYLKKYIFIFNMHVVPDNDRCSAFDRQRLEIKTDGSSSTPAYLKGFLGDTVTFRWLFKLPAGFQPSTGFTHIHQIKAYDGDADSPLITLTPRKATPNRLELIHINSNGVTTKVATTPLAPFIGRWVEAYEKITYGYNGQYSIVLSALEDGTVLFTYANDNLDLWRNGTTVIRPKWGIYRSLSKPSDLRDEQVPFDRFCLAKGTDDCKALKDSPEFAVAAPASGSVAAGGSTTFQIDTDALHGFTGDIKLSVTGLPAGTTASFAPALIAGGNGSSTMTIRTDPGTTAGNYALIVSGVSGILSHVATIPLVVSIDSTPPVSSPSATPAPNVNGWNNSDVTIAVAATDESGGSGVRQITYGATGANSIQTTAVPGPSAIFTLHTEGTTTITYFASDNAGNVETPKTLAVNIDRTTPMITCSAMPSVLWPPNHKLVPVELSVSTSDALSGAAGFTLDSVTSNEPGDGEILGFTIGTSATGGSLRAERLGADTGRVYSLTYHASDRAGNSASCTTNVNVPHDQRD